jgi:hypothetical protein
MYNFSSKIPTSFSSVKPLFSPPMNQKLNKNYNITQNNQQINNHNFAVDGFRPLQRNRLETSFGNEEHRLEIILWNKDKTRKKMSFEVETESLNCSKGIFNFKIIRIFEIN